MAHYVLTFDVGTTFVKAVLHLCSTNGELSIVDALSEPLDLHVNGMFVEQRPEDWWHTVCNLSKQTLQKHDVSVDAVGFCTQMLGLVCIDKDHLVIRDAINYMDARVKHISVASHLGTIARSFLRDHVCSLSEKDVVQKMVWLKQNQLDLYRCIDKFLDVGDYLVMCATDHVCMSSDSAFLTFLYNHRLNRWDKRAIKSYGLDEDKFPEIASVGSCKGYLCRKAAIQLGLPENIPVFSGGDATCIAYASDLLMSNCLHMYWGTSGWVSAATPKFLAHIPSSTTGLLSMQPGIYNLIGQMEITGKTLDLALSILGLTYGDVSGLYDLTPAGANGVLCTPWIGGERTPFSDVTSRGCVTDVGISTTADDIVRAVVEGICLEYLWELRIIERMVACDEPVVFLGGGSVSKDICQVLSDVLGRVVLAHPDGRFCGNLGIARLAFEFIRGDKIVSSVDQTGLTQYMPHDEYRQLYDGLLKKLKKLRKVK